MLATIVSVMVVSPSVAGCTTPTTTPTPSPSTSVPTDYNTTFSDIIEANTSLILIQPFRKSMNARGNDVYIGVVKKRAQLAGRTHLIEITKSESQANQLYAAITEKTNKVKTQEFTLGM